MEEAPAAGVAMLLLLCCLCSAAHAEDAGAVDRKSDYVSRVVRGEGFMPWQEEGVSQAEVAFREEVEERKDRLLAGRVPVEHPVMLTGAEIEQTRRNIETAAWAKAWFATHKGIADYCVEQPDGWVEQMLPELTPGFYYAFTCPNCVGEKSQEASGRLNWRYRDPDKCSCPWCGQVYPGDEYPETATLVCPRSGQTFTYYRNDEERAHPDDRSGEYAYHWVGRPMHVSFTGVIREKKVLWMISAVRSLAFAYQFTGDGRYATRAKQILLRFAHCYRNWLYHDYWDSIADCDPMYAAYHDRELPLEWKRHLCTGAYVKDTAEKAAMLQNYWGGGRIHPSTDVASLLVGVALAYDLVYDATEADGEVWTEQERATVERDFLMEWLMGGEPFLGGPGKATNLNNKAGRVYRPMAAVAKCLGLTDWADTALRGIEAQCEQALAYDGFSHESPAYTFSTASYLGGVLGVAESLHGFRWPEGYGKRTGEVNLYQKGSRVHLLLEALIDHLLPDGRLLPISDTPVTNLPAQYLIDVGLKRMPEEFAGLFRSTGRTLKPSEYAVLHLDAAEVERLRQDAPPLDLPEIYFPALMTAILRHGTGPQSSALALTFCPPGSHRHLDNLSLLYFDRGQTILGDQGYIGDTPMNRWIRSTLSHNLVVVDGQEQVMRSGNAAREPRLRLMATSPKVSVVEASSAGAYPQCAEYRRLVALIKGPSASTFAVDLFRVRGGKKHAYRVFSELAASDADDGSLAFEGADLPPEPTLPNFGGSTNPAHLFGLRDARRSDSPPLVWKAVWSQSGRSYRLWMLTKVEALAAANGPGQETKQQMGRRVRYLDAVRESEDLASTFVAVHEPNEPEGAWAIRDVQRLGVAPAAGADAVALRLDSTWGQYLVFSGFDKEAAVEGVRFQGSFGVLCRPHDDEPWLFAVGASTLQSAGFGFVGKTPRWSGEVAGQTTSTLTSATAKPADWPPLPPGCQSYVLANDGQHHTGFLVGSVEGSSIAVRRFPLPRVAGFELPRLEYRVAGPH